MIKREKYMSIIRGFIDKPLIKVITGSPQMWKINAIAADSGGADRAGGIRG